MKKLTYFYFLSLIIILASCKPNEIKDIGEARQVIKSMAGTWSLTTVQQVDEFAKAQLFPYKTLDLTNLYAYKDMKITFNINESNQPTTFSIVYGNSPKFIKVLSGNWTVNNLDAPSKITFTSGASTDEISIGNYANFDLNQLQLVVKRYQVDSKGNSKLVLSNNYYFKK